jgi:hypothetical protein
MRARTEFMFRRLSWSMAWFKATLAAVMPCPIGFRACWLGSADLRKGSEPPSVERPAPVHKTVIATYRALRRLNW